MRTKLLSLFSLLFILSLSWILTSCSDDDYNPDADFEDYLYTPTSTSDLLGLYTYEDVIYEENYMRSAFFFCEGNKIVVYIDTTSTDGATGILLSGDYEYNSESGFGKMTLDDGAVADFYADKSGFIVFYDDDSEYNIFQEGIWLIKQNFDLGQFNDSIETYDCEYEDDFGCEEYDSASVLDIDDIGYQYDETRKTRADFEWTVANVAKWAGSNIASGAVGAIAGVAVNAIMNEMGVGMGAQLNKISMKLDEIQNQLNTVLKKIDAVLDNQAEAQFNNHKTELNSLANTIQPYFEKVMEEKDSVKRSEYLKEFNSMQGTIKTNTFLDNIASITVQKTTIYDTYDKYIYGCYAWEEQGYAARESFRALDLMAAFRGTVLSVLFYNDRHDDASIKVHLDKFARYLDYYNKTAVKRDNDHAICQISNCKIKINKNVDRRDFKNQTWLKNGTQFESSYFESSSAYHMYWVPLSTINTLAYGNDKNIPKDQYNKMGLSKDEVNKLLDFYKGKSLQTILFDIAKCNNPFTADEMKGKTLCIIRSNPHCEYSKDDTGEFASEKEMSISAYIPTDNAYKLRQVGVPNIGHKDGKRLWYTLWIKKERIPIFNGWKSYNDQYLWCYPTVAR